MQESAQQYLRHGQTPFFRLPRCDTSSASPYQGCGAVLLGVPWDGGTTYQPGARFAPYHVRRVSALVQGHHRQHGIDVFTALRARDGGNVVFPPFSAPAMREAVERETAAVLNAGAVPMVVGGDHSITLPILRSLYVKHGPVAVVHVDAHLDTSGPEVWGETHHHGTPMRHALAEGYIAPGQFYQLGLRATWSHSEEGAFAASHRAHQWFLDDLVEQGIDDVMAEIRDSVGKRPVYLSFDVDAVDPAFAPGTGTPVPGGLSSREALRLVRGLAGAQLCGLDVVEVSPPLDHADMTCHLAAYLLFEGLAVAALNR